MARKELGPASMQVAQAVRRQVDAPMLVACSGGADSLALAVGAAWWSRRARIPCRAIVVDHGLQADSAQVAAEAVANLDRIGLAAEVVPVDVVAGSDGPEAAARNARYAALASAAGRGEVILLGHTRDDQAETVLLGLARGSGTRSLAGMPASRGNFRRPLLGLGRDVTEACCLEAGLTPWVDPHNSDSSFARVRVRSEVLPVLEAQLGPGIAEALHRSALRCREDADFLDELSLRAAASCVIDNRLHCDETAKLPTALKSRVVLLWLRKNTKESLSWANVNSVLALINDWHGQAPATLGGIQIARSGGWLVAASVIR